jgi:hypothetical protein
VNLLAFLMSALLHLGVILAAVYPTSPTKPPEPKPITVKLPPVLGEDDLSFRPLEGVTGDPRACATTYKGIGIRFSGTQIMDVAFHGPAWKAGIRKDWLMIDYTDEADYLVGTFLDIDRKKHRLRIPKVEICQDHKS